MIRVQTKVSVMHYCLASRHGLSGHSFLCSLSFDGRQVQLNNLIERHLKAENLLWCFVSSAQACEFL